MATDLDVLIRAHDANAELGLDLTPEAIVALLEKHTTRGRPKHGRTPYRDPVGDQAAARADRRRR